MAELRDTISKAIPAKHVFYVIDACYGGLLASTRSIENRPRRDLAYLREITKERSRQVLTAGGKNEEVLDGGRKGHSVFTGRLIELLESADDFITANEIQAVIREKVYNDALSRNHTQTPAFGVIYGNGDFVFVPKVTNSSTNTAGSEKKPEKQIEPKAAPHHQIAFQEKPFANRSSEAQTELVTDVELAQLKAKYEGGHVDDSRNDLDVLTHSDSKRTQDFDFVAVPAGCFKTGDREACLDSFKIGKYKITQGQWKILMGNNPSKFKECGELCPVENVSWNDVQDFLVRLNRKTGKNYRLPTEAEWEFACRSGGKTSEFCGPKDAKATAWFYENSAGSTHRTGMKLPNDLGIYDMSGNVWEWCQDRYGTNYPSGRDNPKGPNTGLHRVARGGSWSDESSFVRATSRINRDPYRRYDTQGFRLAEPLK